MVDIYGAPDRITGRYYTLGTISTLPFEFYGGIGSHENSAGGDLARAGQSWPELAAAVRRVGAGRQIIQGDGMMFLESFSHF